MRNIDEILMHTDIDGVTFENLTEREKSNIYSIIEKKTGKEMQKRKRTSSKKFFKVGIAAACFFAVAFTTTFAVEYFGLDQKLGEFLNISGSRQEELNLGITAPMCSVSNNGVTVNVLQTISDTRSLYVVYEVIAPENINLTDDYYFEDISVFPSDKGKNSTFGNSYYVLEQNKNVRKYLTVIDSDCDFKDGKMKLSMTNLCNEANQNKVEIEGEWNTEWEYDTEKVTKIKEISPNVNAEVLCKDTQKTKEMTVEKIIISPISVSVDVSAQNAQSADDNYLAADIKIKMKNGETLICGEGGIGESFSSDTEKGNLHFMLKNIIDTEQVESIIIGDKTINLNPQK